MIVSVFNDVIGPVMRGLRVEVAQLNRISSLIALWFLTLSAATPCYSAASESTEPKFQALPRIILYETTLVQSDLYVQGRSKEQGKQS